MTIKHHNHFDNIIITSYDIKGFHKFPYKEDIQKGLGTMRG